MTVRALPALAVPVVVLVGIYGGIVTVTEAAALAAVASLVVSLVFYRGFRFTQTLSVIADALRSAGTIMLIVATALAFGHWMTESGVPAQLVTWVLAHHCRPGSSCCRSMCCCWYWAASWRWSRRCCW